MTSHPFTLGQHYDRRQIRQILGGGHLVSYLPTKKGRIIAGCFDPRLNRRAPCEIDVGDGTNVIAGAQELNRLKAEIPVFLKRRSKVWEFVGVYQCDAFSQSPQDIKAYADRRKDAVGVLYLRKVLDESTPLMPALELVEAGALEGRKRLVTHLRRERSGDLVIAKRNEMRAAKGCLCCEACELSERELPAAIGEACFEVHHLIPLSELTEERPTKLADLCLLCANCHRMIHRSDPMLTLDQFKQVLPPAKTGSCHA